jgi:hypothetical protein
MCAGRNLQEVIAGMPDLVDDEDDAVVASGPSTPKPQGVSLFALVGREKLKSAKKFADLEKHSARLNNPIPRENYACVMGDVNYGCAKKESRKDKKWLYKDFEDCFANIKEANEADEYVVIMFVHDVQIQVQCFVFEIWVRMELCS